MALEYWGGDHEPHDHENESPMVHLIAGALAGTLEHCGMFPVDTIKTHMQATANSRGSLQTASVIIREHGWKGLFRGITAVASGAVPAHALSFSCYEFVKKVTGANSTGHHPFATSISGAAATLTHDAILTPLDAVKQKMQLSARPYRNMVHCFMYAIRHDGVRSLYSGYTTALTMNLPYSVVYFSTYESAKRVLYSRRRHPQSVAKREHDPVVHMAAGGAAGVMAAMVTTPLDVAKTRLQTQADLKRTYKGMVDALRSIVHEEGTRALLRGMGPRMLYHSASATIAWTTYEQVKWLLGGG